jgi:hypothetical protein
VGVSEANQEPTKLSARSSAALLREGRPQRGRREADLVAAEKGRFDRFTGGGSVSHWKAMFSHFELPPG